MLKLFLKFLYGSLAFYFNSEGIPVPYGFGDITLLICLSSATEGGESVTVSSQGPGSSLDMLWRDDNCTLVVYCFVENCKSAIFSAFLECWPLEIFEHGCFTGCTSIIVLGESGCSSLDHF